MSGAFEGQVAAEGAAGAESPRPPHGWSEILAFYGDIRTSVGEDGTLDPRWEAEHLAMAELPWPLALSWDPSNEVRRIRVHRRLVDLVEITFDELFHAGLSHEVTELGGAFAFRPQRGSHRLSLHAFGAAIDLNPRSNPLGAPGDMHPEVVRVFQSLGWTWGGVWSRPDGQHFQWATGF